MVCFGAMFILLFPEDKKFFSQITLIINTCSRPERRVIMLDSIQSSLIRYTKTANSMRYTFSSYFMKHRVIFSNLCYELRVNDISALDFTKE